MVTRKKNLEISGSLRGPVPVLIRLIEENLPPMCVERKQVDFDAPVALLDLSLCVV